MRLSHFQNKSYILQLSARKNFHLENPSILMGWQSAIVIASTCEKTARKIAPTGAMLQSLQAKSGLRR